MKADYKIMKIALKAVKSANKLKNIVYYTKLKIDENEGVNTSLDSFHQKLQALVRMVKSHLNGEFKIPLNTLIFLVFGLVYFVVPTDSIPDIIPAIGFSDDVTVIYFIYRKMDGDIAEYLDWERSKAQANS